MTVADFDPETYFPSFLDPLDYPHLRWTRGARETLRRLASYWAVLSPTEASSFLRSLERLNNMGSGDQREVVVGADFPADDRNFSFGLRVHGRELISGGLIYHNASKSWSLYS